MNQPDIKLHRNVGAWQVGDYPVQLVREWTRWIVFADSDTDFAWLKEVGLEGTQFATRRDAHRAVLAALAARPINLEPAPAKVRKTGPNRWETLDGHWAITYHGDSLRKGWGPEEQVSFRLQRSEAPSLRSDVGTWHITLRAACQRISMVAALRAARVR